MLLRVFLSITVFGVIGALIWVSRPEGPPPSDEELRRELVVEAAPTPRAPTQLTEGELARAFRVVSAKPAQAPAAPRAMATRVFSDDSIPGSRLVRELEGRPEADAARAVKQRLAELSASDALERAVLRDYVRDKIRSTELARDIAVQEMRGDNAANLPADPAWQVDYLTSYMNIYVESGKNDDSSMGAAIDAIVSQTGESARVAMSQALLARAHDGSLSVQDALAARGVALPEGERNPSATSQPRPVGAIEASF